MPGPLSDLTHQATQVQNMAPVTQKLTKPHCHNPYGYSVLPHNPEAVLLQRTQKEQLTELSRQWSDIRSKMNMNIPLSPLLLSSAYLPPFGPLADAFVSQAPSSPVSTVNLTKVYIGGRPVAVASNSPAKAPQVEEPPVTAALIQVAFRRSEAEYFLGDAPAVFGTPCGESTIVGKYVIVEGDRGEDIGRVASITVLDKAQNTKGALLVKRVATTEDVQKYEVLRRDELKALDYAQQQCQRLFSEHVRIEDATFQFDKQKLTLWYRVPERIYFVPLLKVLNQCYRCRIWMERIEEQKTEHVEGEAKP